MLEVPVALSWVEERVEGSRFYQNVV